jgi:hypothetical protein
MKRIKPTDKNISPNQRRLRLMELSGIPITEREKRKITEGVVSMVEPSKYHNRTSPTGRLMKTFGNDTEEIELGNSTEDDIREYIRDIVRERFHEEMEEDDFDFELQEMIDELEDEIMMDEILEEMGLKLE